jgi:hypothetical protein
MSYQQKGELFNAFTGGRTPAMSSDTRVEIALGCSSLSAAGPPPAGHSRGRRTRSGSRRPKQGR